MSTFWVIRRVADDKEGYPLCEAQYSKREYVEKLEADYSSLLADRDRLAGELQECAEALPGVAYMDPPDGGSPSIAEQVRRMYADLRTQVESVTRLTAELSAARADAEKQSEKRSIACAALKEIANYPRMAPVVYLLQDVQAIARRALSDVRATDSAGGKQT